MTDFKQDPMKIKAEGIVRPGPGTTQILITIPDGWEPLSDGEVIDIDSFADYLRDLTEKWMVEVIRTPK
jgi:hypothetical protein